MEREEGGCSDLERRDQEDIYKGCEEKRSCSHVT